MRKMFIAKRDRQYSVVQDVRKCEASYEYMVSDFCLRNTTPNRMTTATFQQQQQQQHFKAEVNKLKKKVETIKDTIAAHDDSLFSEITGKLQTGLTCHHKFNSDTLHLISTGILNNIAQLFEDLETASKKYKATNWFQNQCIN